MRSIVPFPLPTRTSERNGLLSPGVPSKMQRAVSMGAQRNRPQPCSASTTGSSHEWAAIATNGPFKRARGLVWRRSVWSPSWVVSLSIPRQEASLRALIDLAPAMLVF